MSEMLQPKIALEELSSSESPLGHDGSGEAQPLSKTDIVYLSGLRGYAVQIEYLEERITQEETTPQLWLIDNLGVRSAPNSNEIARLIGLAWQQKSRLHNARVAWVTTRNCGIDPKMALTLPAKLRTFKTLSAARAWLLEEA